MLGKIAIYLLIIGIIWVYIRYIEKKSIFYPTRQIEYTPKDVGLLYEDVYFKSKDGVLLNGWFVPAEDSKRTVLFCHGNAGNISHRIDMAKLFNGTGINIFLFDYRGYGKSKGTPSEKGLYLDALGAYDYLLNRKDIDSSKIIVFGESLGGAVAIDLATRTKPAAVICESTFTSSKDMARIIYPVIPTQILVTQRFDSLSKIKDIRVPKLIMHSRNDEIIPFEQGQRLFMAAAEPKEFYEMYGGHNEAKFINRTEFISGIVEFLDIYVK